MPPPTNPSNRPALLILLSAVVLAAGFLSWVNHGRQERVEYVSGLGVTDAVPDPASPTGWAGHRRWLIASEHNNDSYQWIMETQQMLASGEWRLRRVVYDNGANDRAVSTASPYRWWLALVAKTHHRLTGQPLALSVERAALYADPVLLALFLLAGTVLVARSLGLWPAIVFLVGGALLYPFSAIYSPGAPDHLGLSVILGLTSVLLPAVGACAGHGPAARRWMLLAGVAGGLGLWVNLFVELPFLLGLALGGAVAAFFRRDEAGAGWAGHWRAWGRAGAITCLAAYAIEFLPSGLPWPLRGNHPLAAVAWLGAAELVALLNEGRPGGKPGARWRVWILAGVALLAVAALPYALWKSEVPWLQGRDVFGTRLTSLPLAGAATSFGAWVKQDGIRLQTLGTILPVLWLLYPLWLVWRRTTLADDRAMLVQVVLPLVVVIPLAWLQLRWWALVDGLLLVLGVMVTAHVIRQGRRLALTGWLALLGITLIPAVVCQKPAAKEKYQSELTQLETEGVVERSLAHWLAQHSATPPRVLAPPFRTTALCYFGNFQGLGSLNLDNKEAMSAAARIASSTSPEEAQALIARRNLTHVIVPSWDDYLMVYARLFTSRPENSFVARLAQWSVPSWLRPVAYQLPTIGGFEDQTVFIFEVGEEQDQVTALSQLSEYFIEMGQMGLAQSVTESLRAYPGNLAALMTIAQFDAARGDGAGFSRTFAALRSNYASSDEHEMSWDRRVSLAVVLMQGKQADLARQEMQLCLNLMDEARLRSLSMASLYRFQVLLGALDLKIEDAKLRTLARSLLPDTLRNRL